MSWKTPMGLPLPVAGTDMQIDLRRHMRLTATLWLVTFIYCAQAPSKAPSFAPSEAQSMKWVEPNMRVTSADLKDGQVVYTTVPMTASDKPRVLEAEFEGHRYMLIEQVLRR